MREFNIGDIVKKNGGSKSFLYIVTDFNDHSIIKGSKEVVDIDYEVTQIFPVSILTYQSIVGQNDLIIHAKHNSKDNEFVLEFIKKEREARGLFGKPDYITIIENNLKKETEIEQQKNLDIVRYDLLKTVDECLDAMNDLEALYNTFGDELYLELKDLIKDKLKEIID